MIGMPREDLLGAVELLGQESAHEEMRPGDPAEGEDQLGPREGRR